MRTHTVYKGDFIGMVLAVELLRRTKGRIRSVSLGLDKMATTVFIQVIDRTRPQPGSWMPSTTISGAP